MKSLKSILIALLLFSGLFGATMAQARPGHFYGPHFGVFIDPWPALYAGSYYPYGYYPYGSYPYAYAPVVVQQPAQQVYVEQGQQGQVSQVPQAQGQQQAVPAPSSDWFYCRNPQGYYPYVRNCAEGWQRVPAQPPAPQQH